MVFAFPSGLNQEMFPLAWLVGEWEGEGQISYHEQVPPARAWNHIKFTHDGGTYLKYESVIRIIGEGEAELPGPVLQTENFDSPEVQALLASRSAQATSAQPYEVPGYAPGEGSDNMPDADQVDSGDGSGSASGISTDDAEQANSGGDSGSASNNPTDDVAAVSETQTSIPGEGDSIVLSETDQPNANTQGAAVDPQKGEVWSSETGYWRVSPLRDGSMAANEFALDVFMVDAGGRMTYFNGDASPARVILASAKIIRAALAAEVDGSKRMYGYVNDHLAWAEDIVAFGHELSSYASFLLARTVDGDGNPVVSG
jgi:hypothetical protein